MSPGKHSGVTFEEYETEVSKWTDDMRHELRVQIAILEDQRQRIEDGKLKYMASIVSNTTLGDLHKLDKRLIKLDSEMGKFKRCGKLDDEELELLETFDYRFTMMTNIFNDLEDKLKDWDDLRGKVVKETMLAEVARLSGLFEYARRKLRG